MGHTKTDLTVYRTGKIRLPADFQAREVVVEFRQPDILVIRIARDGEIGLTPQLPRFGKSAHIAPLRAFKRLGIDPKRVAGDYVPIRRDDVLEVRLKSEDDGDGRDSV